MKGVFTMTNNFEAKVNSIISNLNSKISQLAAKGENKNKQIETRGEKNQLSELLAGAEKEIDNAAKSYEKQIENLPHKKYVQLAKIKDTIIYTAKAHISSIQNQIELSLKSFETMKDVNGVEKVANKDDVRQIYSDNSYNREVKSFGKSGYLVERMTEEGKGTGKYRLYKNNKEYYTNKDYVAKKMGLYPASTNLINELFGTKPKETDIYLKNGDGYVETYAWDNKTSQFILKDVEWNVHAIPTEINCTYTIGETPKENQAKNIKEGLNKYNVRIDE